MIQKPKNNKELAALIGKKAVVDNWPGNGQKCTITGVNTNRNENPHVDSEFSEVWVYVNWKPKGIKWEQIKDIEAGEPVSEQKPLPKWLPIWLIVSAIVGYGIGVGISSIMQ